MVKPQITLVLSHSLTTVGSCRTPLMTCIRNDPTPFPCCRKANTLDTCSCVIPPALLPTRSHGRSHRLATVCSAMTSGSAICVVLKSKGGRMIIGQSYERVMFGSGISQNVPMAKSTSLMRDESVRVWNQLRVVCCKVLDRMEGKTSTARLPRPPNGAQVSIVLSPIPVRTSPAKMKHTIVLTEA